MQLYWAKASSLDQMRLLKEEFGCALRKSADPMVMGIKLEAAEADDLRAQNFEVSHVKPILH